MNWKDFLAFRRMVTPIIIQVIFWIGVVGVILGGIVGFFSMLITGISQGEAMSILGALIGVPLMTIVGLLLVRLYTELLIVIFRINDTLTDIKNLLEERRQA
ncbi:MAG TPA: DUF4282 domain-containing protein [Chloroflexi bacterium]|nr:DUF4282 domain-containing protein [Chloroflexota bacterium]